MQANPFTRGGRVWSTSHCGFVNVSHYFLDMLTTGDAHQRKCCLTLCTHANRVACIQCSVVWYALNRPVRTTQKLNITVYHNQHRITDCTLYYYLPTADSATQTGDVKLTRSFLLYIVKGLACETKESNLRYLIAFMVVQGHMQHFFVHWHH